MVTVKNLHFNVAILSRSGSTRQTGNQKKRPQNALAAAAYRSGEKLVDFQAKKTYDYNPRDGAIHPDDYDALSAAAYRAGASLHHETIAKTYDFTRKENVVYSAVLVPEGAPAWSRDRQALWTATERAEKRKDAQLARDIIAALPRDLTREQHIALVNEFVRENFTSRGMVADVNIHEKDASDGGKNPHVHIMLTMRDLQADGFGGKNRTWNNRGLVETWRTSFERLSNETLENTESDYRVSLKSYERQGIDKTPQKHMGYEAFNLEKKGTRTAKNQDNRRIRHRNKVNEVMSEPTPARGADAPLGSEPPKDWGNSFEPAARASAAPELPPEPPVYDWLGPGDWERDHYREAQIVAEMNKPKTTRAQQHQATVLSIIEAGFTASLETISKADAVIVYGFDRLRDVGYDAFQQLMGWDEPERRLDLVREPPPVERERDFER